MRYIFLFVVLIISRMVIAQDLYHGIGDTLHAIHYEINLEEVDTDDRSITAHTIIRLTPLVESINSIPLDFKDLTVDSVLVNDEQSSFSHSNEILRIQLNQPLNLNEEAIVNIYYHGKPFSENWGGFHFDGDYAFNLGVGFESIPHNLGKTWFPCIDDFTDRATYSLNITVENDKKAIGGGMLAGVTDKGDGTSIWHWEMEERIPTYLISVAVGDYVLVDDYFVGMEDTIPIHIYTRPADTAKVQGSFINLKQILQWFEEKFGPYPFGRVGYTSTATGAMEHATNIAYPHFAINGNTSYESLYTHELTHMWFGDKITCSSAEDMWLNEGWATFCEIYYLNDLYGYEDFRTLMRKEHREVLRRTHKVDGGYFALNDVPQNITYGSHSYDKGGTVANTLRGYLGDSLFFEAITAYLNHFAYQSISSHQMRDFLTDFTGIDMTGFFDAWVMTPGTPHFAIDSTKITEGDASFYVDIWLKQKYKGADFFANDNVLEVTFMDENFNFVNDTIHFSGKTGHSVKYLSFEPKAIFLDLFEKICDATTDNYRFFTEPEEYSFPNTYFRLIVDELNDSALIRATHNWVAPDSLIIPVEGLRLSPYRHWKIEGLWPEGSGIKGRFLYDKSNYLDDDLILSDSDSVVILYRKDAGDQWHEVSQSVTGVWNIGYIVVNDFEPGEYTLAVWDKTVVGTNDDLRGSEEINIFPNPNNGHINFEFPQKGKYNIKIYNAKGAQLEEFTINGKSKSWKWRNRDVSSGLVFVHVYEGRKLVTIRKLVVVS